MLGVPTTNTHAATPTTSIDGGAMLVDADDEAHHQDGSGGEFVGGAAEGSRRASSSGGGNKRWPRQETMALLKIRSEMDAEFRDSSYLKGPLWDEVCREMMELGYNRNAKKCREKFENLFSYYKRRKEGKTTYKFFTQLVALEDNNVTPPPSPPSQSGVHLLPPPPPPHYPPEAQMLVVHEDPTTTPPSNNETVTQPSQHSHQINNNKNYIAFSSTPSYDDIERKRNEEYYNFMEVIMKNVIEKQEELHKKIMETIEKNERERMIREVAWRNQEMERIKREYDLLAQERSNLATTNATLLSFLENITHLQQNPKNSSSETNNTTTQFQPPMPPQSSSPVMLPSSFADVQELEFTMTQPAPPRPPPFGAPLGSHSQVTLALPATLPRIHTNSHHLHQDGNDDDGTFTLTPPSSSSPTWAKTETEALIKIRASVLASKEYQVNGPIKRSLWVQVSIELNKLGYNKNPRRCKQKWENINKYFKKINKDNNAKKRSCSYFQLLDALYKEKAKDAEKPNSPLMEEDLEMEDVDYEEVEGEGDR